MKESQAPPAPALRTLLRFCFPFATNPRAKAPLRRTFPIAQRAYGGTLLSETIAERQRNNRSHLAVARLSDSARRQAHQVFSHRDNDYADTPALHQNQSLVLVSLGSLLCSWLSLFDLPKRHGMA